MRRVRAHLTYANVVSSLCLFLLVGGTAWAAATITGEDVRNESLTGNDIKNASIKGRDIKNATIKGRDIKNATIKGRDVGDGSLSAKDFKLGALPSGPVGPKGDIGPTGRQGPAGKDGTNGTGGTGGSSIVNRTRSSGPVTPTAANTSVPVPLTNNTWTQQADEIDQLFGSVNITRPASASCADDMELSNVNIVVERDGIRVASASASFDGTGTAEVPIEFNPAFLFEPGSAMATNTVTAEFSDSCSTPGTLNLLRISVIGTQ